MKKKSQGKLNKLEQGLLKGLKEAVQYQKGKISLRTTTLEIPNEPPQFSKSEVKEAREQLNVSQPVFALILGVSDGTVKAWESGTNSPSGSSARLIQMMKASPDMFQEMLKSLPHQ